MLAVYLVCLAVIAPLSGMAHQKLLRWTGHALLFALSAVASWSHRDNMLVVDSLIYGSLVAGVAAAIIIGRLRTRFDIRLPLRLRSKDVQDSEPSTQLVV